MVESNPISGAEVRPSICDRLRNDLATCSASTKHLDPEWSSSSCWPTIFPPWGILMVLMMMMTLLMIVEDQVKTWEITWTQKTEYICPIRQKFRGILKIYENVGNHVKQSVTFVNILTPTNIRIYLYKNFNERMSEYIRLRNTNKYLNKYSFWNLYAYLNIHLVFTL